MKSIGMLSIILLFTPANGADNDEAKWPFRNSRRQRCNSQTEQPCVKCFYDETGNPTAVQYCADNSQDCPLEVCCDIATEEKCFDDTTGDPTSCRRYDEGGCPCLVGEYKCGVSIYSSGYCTDTLEDCNPCYDDGWTQVDCQRYEDGPDGPYPVRNSSSEESAASQFMRVNYSVDDEEEFNEPT